MLITLYYDFNLLTNNCIYFYIYVFSHNCRGPPVPRQPASLVDVPDLELEDGNPAVDGDLGLQVHGDPTVAVHGQGLVDGPALDGLDNPAVAEGPVPSIHGTVVDVQGLDLGDMPDVDLLDVDLLDVHVEGHDHVDAVNSPAVEED